jgi:hypothetical protein
MKIVLAAFALLTLVGVAVIAGLSLAAAMAPGFGGMHLPGAPGVLGAGLGLFIAALAVVFALVVTVLALAGAFLAELFALLLAGLILLAIALPFLLPFIVAAALIFAVVLIARGSNRPRAV